MSQATNRSSDHRSGMLKSLGTAGISVLYVLYMIVSTVFGAVLFLFYEMFRDPRCRRLHRDRHISGSAAGAMVADALWAVLAYVLADYLRCALWMKTSWPEVVPDYGSTIVVHIKMLAVVAISWPIILYCLGWYRLRWRPLRWRILRTIAGLAILGLVMSAAAVLLMRLIYPRYQIAFLIVSLPALTSILRSIADVVRRVRSGAESDTPKDWC